MKIMNSVLVPISLFAVLYTCAFSLGILVPLALISEAHATATFRGTVEAVTPTSIVVITGVGEALRLHHVDVKTSTIHAGDIVEVTGNKVAKCRLNQFGLVVSCP